MKTQDYLWTDPPANELIQRHRIGSLTPSNKRHVISPGYSSPKSPRPGLTVQVKRAASLGPDELTSKLTSVSRDCVMSMHQSGRLTLLYGKNNVMVHPVDCRNSLSGYLSLHQNAKGLLFIRWYLSHLQREHSRTPNELMNSSDSDSLENGGNRNDEKQALCNFAINLNVEEIAYIHVHQHDVSSGGSVVLIGADGVQHQRIVFPCGHSPLTFLAQLENGLLPRLALEPSLWLEKGKEKVFPRMPKDSVDKRSGRPADKNDISHNSFTSPTVAQPNGSNGSGLAAPSDSTESLDFVFRIVCLRDSTCGPQKIPDSSGNAVKGSHPLSSQQTSSTKSKGNVFNLSNLSGRFKERFISVDSSSHTPQSSNSIGSSSPTSLASSPNRSPAPSSPSQSPSFYHTSNDHKYSHDAICLPNLVQSSASSKTNECPDSPSRRLLMSVCDSMKHQIIVRAFYGWLAYVRHLRVVRLHLSCLVDSVPIELTTGGLTPEVWTDLLERNSPLAELSFCRHVYSHGMQDAALRKQAWPFLIGLLKFGDPENQRQLVLTRLQTNYESRLAEWLSAEAVVRQREMEVNSRGRLAAQTTLPASVGNQNDETPLRIVNDERDDELDEVSFLAGTHFTTAAGLLVVCIAYMFYSGQICVALYSFLYLGDTSQEPTSRKKNFFIAEDSGRSTPEEGDGALLEFNSQLEAFALNLHRIEKDVCRCDRNHAYFTQDNLEKLKNVMCTYVWEHPDFGYVQGMCDLAAPLLVILDNEIVVYGCFCELMKRMSLNFPHGGQMDIHFANMRALIQVLDPELFELMQSNGDYTHVYFCYRWFLLDFKREVAYSDVFLIWETIWAARRLGSKHFILFLALALLQSYRDVIIANHMDFTDIIKFFNEMAEKHDGRQLLSVAKDLVTQLQTLIAGEAK